MLIELARVAVLSGYRKYPAKSTLCARLHGDKKCTVLLFQMKISKSQQLLAYTLETEQGSETYTVYVHDLHAGIIQGSHFVSSLMNSQRIGALFNSFPGQQEQLLMSSWMSTA